MLTPKQKFYLAIHVVKDVPITELLQKLKLGRHITEKSVLDESESLFAKSFST